MTLQVETADEPRRLRLYFPEWQGYASHDGSRRGAKLIREQVYGSQDVTDVEVARDEEQRPAPPR
jgi:hypothetical protein